jgi:hypothetical protein
MTSRGQIYLNALLVLLSVAFSLFVCEVGLRILYGSPSERVLDYKDTWRQVDPSNATFGPGGFLKEGFEGKVQDGFGGTVRWKNNSQGFRNEVEFVVPKPARTYRVLSIGDSFTGGYRVGQDDTFSALTEDIVARRNPTIHVEIMVSVIEDPAFGLLFLQEHGLGYEPDLVILGITLGNDIQQTLGRLFFTLDIDRERGRIYRKSGESKPPSLTRDQFETIKLPARCLAREMASPDSLPPPAVQTYGTRKAQGLRLIELLSRAKDSLSRGEAQTVVSPHGAYHEPLL